MLIHANSEYVGEYSGKHGERHQDSEDYMGFHRRQQINDNLHIVNQLKTDWSLTDYVNLEIGVSYNNIKGLEPDRRENYLSRMTDGNYILTGSNRQKRFFSTLKENDVNTKAILTYRLIDRFGSGKSSIKFGYTGRNVKDRFEAVEYNFTAVPGTIPMNPLRLNDFYNDANLKAGLFAMTTGETNSYEVTKFIHSGFAEGTYQLSSRVTGNVGLRMDIADLTVNHHVQHVQPGEESIRKNYYLPSLNLKYDPNDKNSLRLGASKSYTLPQSKEISPYQYVNISFSSQGNPNIKPSDNFNFDLKWDYYMSPGELLTLTGFYKYIVNPIGRVDQGNSAGLLTYDNISDHAVVGGLEFEFRKNLFNRFNTQLEKMNRLSVGLNASYIYTNLTLDMLNTESRNSGLEGASPFLANLDFSYTHTKREKNFVASLIFNYFSHRIHTIGAKGFKDIIEEGVPNLDFASSYSLNSHLSLKLKAQNLLNASYRLSRESSLSDEKIILNEYKKGLNISLGASYEF
jgi:TonB-dependent receptor